MVISAMFMVIVFMVVFSELNKDNTRDKKSMLAEDFAYSVQNEFIIATQVLPGYRREFFLPYTLEGFDYTISIINNVLRINYTDNVFELPIPEINGVIQKGKNIIVNQNNTICLNC